METKNGIKFKGFWINSYFGMVSFCVSCLSVFVISAWLTYFNIINGPHAEPMGLTSALGMLTFVLGIMPWKFFKPTEVPKPMFMCAIVGALLSAVFILMYAIS